MKKKTSNFFWAIDLLIGTREFVEIYRGHKMEFNLIFI
jgi:3'-phosphoadenosine 5'-phosphosulfate (PAPS) 3'-phosphatase